MCMYVVTSGVYVMHTCISKNFFPHDAQDAGEMIEAYARS
jgi:hypothetical protein